MSKKDFDVWLIEFSNRENLMSGRHHGLIVKHPLDRQLVYLFPMTTKMNKFNQNNPYFIEVMSNNKVAYVNLSQMEVKSISDPSFIRHVRTDLSFEEKNKIKDAFQKMFSTSVERLNKNIFKQYPDNFIVHQFTEDIYNQNTVIGQRTIDAVLMYSKKADYIPGNPSINHYYKLNSKGVKAEGVSTSFFRSSDTTKIVKEMSYSQYQQKAISKKQKIGFDI